MLERTAADSGARNFGSRLATGIAERLSFLNGPRSRRSLLQLAGECIAFNIVAAGTGSSTRLSLEDAETLNQVVSQRIRERDFGALIPPLRDLSQLLLQSSTAFHILTEGPKVVEGLRGNPNADFRILPMLYVLGGWGVWILFPNAPEYLKKRIWQPVITRIREGMSAGGEMPEP